MSSEQFVHKCVVICGLEIVPSLRSLWTRERVDGNALSKPFPCMSEDVLQTLRKVLADDTPSLIVKLCFVRSCYRTIGGWSPWMAASHLRLEGRHGS